MTVLTRTGYLVNGGPLQDIKKELTVRPIVNGDYGFPPPPFKFLKRLKMVYVSRASMASPNLGSPRRTKGLNQPGSKPDLLEPFVTQHTKMKHLLQLLRRVMAFSHFHVVLGRPPYPWP